MKNGLLILFVTATLLVVGCGFHLRGSDQTAAIPLTYVLGGDPNSGVRSELLHAVSAGQFTEQDSADAQYALTILSENVSQRVLSVTGSTGKVREFVLLYDVSFAVQDRTKSEAPTPQTISLSRDYRFNADQVLGNEQEEALLRRDMAREAAQQIIRRLQAQAR